MSSYRKKEFSNIEELFEKESRVAQKEKTEYDKLVTRIVNAIAANSARRDCDHDDKMFEYHFTGLSFYGYNDKRCIEYVIQELEKRDFLVEFMDETRNFYISWEHYIPEYKRRHILEQTGIVIDKFGRYVRNMNDETSEEKRKEAEEHAQVLLELRKRKLEESQFQQVRNHGVYDRAALQSLRNIYSSTGGPASSKQRAGRGKAGRGGGGGTDGRLF